MKPAISVKNLGKKYRIRGREVGYKTFREAILDAVAAPVRRLAGRESRRAPDSDFWALREVSFDVQPGEVIGIIGRNGAGKSTLLKILSRITDPTTGRVEIRGRVGSLLEVGTGFHPELTGRENIYMNGSILGMKKVEIDRKFDEIVAFAEVEKFLDTPVKRYSSGMYVRLAFAVAAHLEPEILIVDEVLAVGDMAFQKKCLGKMERVSKEGRTVLFVSHSMPTITSVTQRCILLEHGRIIRTGATSEVVLCYCSNGALSPSAVDFSGSDRTVGDDCAILLGGEIKNAGNEVSPEIRITEPFSVEMRFRVLKRETVKYKPNFHFYTSDGICAFVTGALNERLGEGEYSATCHIPGNFLNEGTYFVSLGLTSMEPVIRGNFHEHGILSFNVRDPIEGTPGRDGYCAPVPGTVRPLLEWGIERIDEPRPRMRINRA